MNTEEVGKRLELNDYVELKGKKIESLEISVITIQRVIKQVNGGNFILNLQGQKVRRVRGNQPEKGNLNIGGNE